MVFHPRIARSHPNKKTQSFAKISKIRG